MGQSSTSLAFNRTVHVATFLLLLACSGCGQGTKEPSVSVPPDCQKFLDRWFEALKAKDVATVQDLSSQLPPQHGNQMSKEGAEMMRQSKRKFAADTFQKMTTICGDFRSYSVLGVNVTTISPTNTIAANMMGAGTHAEIVCKTRFSKSKSVRIGLHLFKETEEAEYSAMAWKFQVDL